MSSIPSKLAVVNRADGSVPYHRVPLLRSPFSYTTYRGS